MTPTSPPSTAACPCQPSYEYCSSDGCATYTGCTEVDSPGRPWCIINDSGGQTPYPIGGTANYYFYDAVRVNKVCYADGSLRSLSTGSISFWVYCTAGAG